MREPFEHEHYNIRGKLMPLGQLMEHAGELDADKQWLSIVKRYPKCDRYTTPCK